MTHVILAVRMIWIALSFLIFSLSTYKLSLLESTYDVSSLISIMAYGMMLISFPIGVASFFTLIVIGFISSVMGVNIDNKYIAAVTVWISFLPGGYLQWFLLAEFIRKKSRK